MNTNREQYEKDLAERQKSHLDEVNKNLDYKRDIYWRPCMHDECPSCHGTGIKIDGSSCIHGISCPCPKCSVMC